MMSEQINELAAALAKAQGAMHNAAMNKTNPHFKSKYADLASVIDAMRGPLSANGLSIVQVKAVTERGLILKTLLLHTSGQYISSEYPLPATTRPHEMGSALTYARRYSLSALICNATDEDDDGNAAQTVKPENKPELVKPATPQPTQQPPKRENPHVTRWQDIYDRIDTSDIKIDPSIPKVTVAKAKDEYKVLIHDMHRQTDERSLVEWADIASPTVSSFPTNIQEFFRAAYAKYKDELDPKDGTNFLMAG